MGFPYVPDIFQTNESYVVCLTRERTSHYNTYSLSPENSNILREMMHLYA